MVIHLKKSNLDTTNVKLFRKHQIRYITSNKHLHAFLNRNIYLKSIYFCNEPTAPQNSFPDPPLYSQIQIIMHTEEALEQGATEHVIYHGSQRTQNERLFIMRNDVIGSCQCTKMFHCFQHVKCFNFSRSLDRNECFCQSNISIALSKL